MPADMNDYFKKKKPSGNNSMNNNSGNRSGGGGGNFNNPLNNISLTAEVLIEDHRSYRVCTICTQAIYDHQLW